MAPGYTCECPAGFDGVNCEKDLSVEVDPCGKSHTAVGYFATWSGKVNVYKSAKGDWAVDPDCSSGANVAELTYCKKFWNNTAKFVEMQEPTTVKKPFTGSGCLPVYESVRQKQFACCKKDGILIGDK